MCAEIQNNYRLVCLLWLTRPQSLMLSLWPQQYAPLAGMPNMTITDNSASNLQEQVY